MAAKTLKQSEVHLVVTITIPFGSIQKIRDE
jgi:hypothetical protein